MSEKETNRKKLYQRWWVWVLGIIVLLIVWRIGSSAIDDTMTKEIPNVMSINYTEAETVLKENGFKVKAVETDAESILSNNKMHNRSVKKGEVFKINDSTDPNYIYGETKDKKITIYYAKDDYTYEKPTETAMPVSANKQEKSNLSDSSDWRQFLKDYESWMNSYTEFAAKYKNNPTDANLTSQSAKFLKESAEWTEKANNYTDKVKELSPNDLNEYLQTLSRIAQKINQVAN